MALKLLGGPSLQPGAKPGLTIHATTPTAAAKTLPHPSLYPSSTTYPAQ